MQNRPQENVKVNTMIERLVEAAKNENIACYDVCTQISETWAKEGK